jgi:uncharacterized membrane protein
VNLPPKPSRLKTGEATSLACVIGLNLLYLTTSLLDEKFVWTLLLIPCLSLLMFVPGMLRQHARTYNWLCFVILMHFTVGVSNAMAPNGAWNDYLQTLLCVILFISAMMTSRWLQAWQAQSLNAEQGVHP